MKIFKNINKTKKTALIATISVALFLAVVSIFYVLVIDDNSVFNRKIDLDNKTDGIINTNNPTDSQLDASGQIKKDSVDQDQKKIIDSNNINVSVSAVQDNNVVRVRAIIQKTTNSGVCSLVASKDSIVITKQTDIQALSSYSTCRGFDISTNELTSGKWKVVVNFYSTNKKGRGSTEVIVE